MALAAFPALDGVMNVAHPLVQYGHRSSVAQKRFEELLRIRLNTRVATDTVVLKQYIADRFCLSSDCSSWFKVRISLSYHFCRNQFVLHDFTTP